jgi:pimeloyl-ACP methyl ester carboxylesterase
VEKVFKWRRSEISYVEFGQGPQLMIAFHGYGQDAKVYCEFESALSEKYTVVAVDLPHQGKTVWNEKTELEASELAELIRDFLTHLGHSGNVSLMAYSLGGNYATGFFMNNPTKIDELWLIAADGLGPKKLFRLLTRTMLGRLFFRGFVHFPQPILFGLWLLKELKVYEKHVYQFFYNNISSKDRREELYKRWISASRLNVPRPKLISALNNSSVKLKMLFGIHDKVIPVAFAKYYFRKVSGSKLVLLEQGHQLIRQSNAEALKTLLD